VKTDGTPNARVAMGADKERFLELFTNRLLGKKV
jgi:inosine-uridine nucleoside N-ribohydrolase